LSATLRCAACKRSNGPEAKFCRHCGVALEPAITPFPLENVGEPSFADEAPASASSFDDRRLFRELCLLCGLPLLISIAYTIAIKLGGLSALADCLATGATALIALGGAASSYDVVRAALRWPRARDWLATLLVALVAAPVLSLAFWLIQQLGFQMFEGYLAPYLADGWPVWVGYVDVALLTPVFEELLFRGLLQPKLELALSSTEAWIVQAALFAAAHLSPVILVTHFGMGLALGWVRRRSGSLLPGIVLHAAWNAWVVWSSA
jgi:membrane protease YdiL (CAAX protease family)